MMSHELPFGGEPRSMQRRRGMLPESNFAVRDDWVLVPIPSAGRLGIIEERCDGVAALPIDPAHPENVETIHLHELMHIDAELLEPGEFACPACRAIV